MNITDNNSFYSESEKYLKSLNNNYIKSNGIAYTPAWIAKHITSTAFKQWTKFNSGKKPSSACDLCCGTGVFIKEMISLIENSSFNTKITAFDIDEGALEKANIYFGSHRNVVNIEKKNTLLDVDSLIEPKPVTYDIIVGNPPFVNHKALDDNYKSFLTNNYYSSSAGVFDLSIVFIEKILNSLKPGGVASVILSNKFMSSKYGKNICEILASKCNIIKIEDFNDLQLFKGLTTYTCILTFINSKPAKRHTLAKAIYETKNKVSSMPKMVEETISNQLLLQHPWNFHTKEEASIHKKFNADIHKSIYDIFDAVQQGIRTGANDVFILKKEEKNKFNDVIVREFVSGENICGLNISDTNQFVIYPYKLVDGKYTSLSEKEFKNNHTVVYNYLYKKKNILGSRSLQGNTNWYEFSRSQSLDVINSPKIFIREMMPTAIFSADIEGKYAFSSGYALICKSMKRDEILAWAAILSTPIMEFFMRHIGTQLHSGWFRIMKNHLDNLKLPALSNAKFNKIINLVNKNDSNLENRVNEIVANTFHLEKEEVAYIDDTLSIIHKKSRPKGKKDELSHDNKYEPVKLSKYNKKHIERDDLRQTVTFSQNKKHPIHNWYKYTQGFSPKLVNTLLDELGATKRSTVLDPFNGCGTTTVTCAYRGISSIGIEISPLMCLVTKIKSRIWNLDKIRSSLDIKISRKKHISNFIFKEYFEKAYSGNILKSLVRLSEYIKSIKDEEIKDFYTIGILSILEDVSKIRKHGSHYRFLDNTSSVGLQKLNINVIDENADIDEIFSSKLTNIYEDICATGGAPKGKVKIVNESSLKTSLKKESVNIIITSPPYLNRNNYIAQQKAELDILDIIANKAEYKKLVKSTFRSHTDSDLTLEPHSTHSIVNKIIDNIELEEGNNPKIPHMICGYFYDLEASLKECYRLLKTGGKAAFVVGNTRWGGVVVPIDHILAKMAEQIGFAVDSIYVTRLKGNSPQQMKRFGKIPVRESIVNLTKE